MDKEEVTYIFNNLTACYVHLRFQRLEPCQGTLEPLRRGVVVFRAGIRVASPFRNAAYVHGQVPFIDLVLEPRAAGAGHANFVPASLLRTIDELAARLANRHLFAEHGQAVASSDINEATDALVGSPQAVLYLADRLTALPLKAFA